MQISSALLEQNSNIDDRLRCWDTFADWFAARGYTLYERVQRRPFYVFPSKDILVTKGDAKYPFPYFGDWLPSYPPFAVGLSDSSGGVFFAQDSQDRHVAIKVVKNGSDELRILQMLKDEEIMSSPWAFPSLIPVLDLLPFGDYVFVVMPRWGTAPTFPAFQQTFEVYDFIHAMLNALAFLHQRKIVHRDIAQRNMLVSHLGQYDSDWSANRAFQRRKRRLQYALFDFNISIMFPPNATLSECRLPYRQSWIGNVWYHTPDTAQGEYDYDPFALDVGTLGKIFCKLFQHHIPNAPLLAPLFDKMVTRNIQSRFTAPQALQFFQKEVLKNSTKEQLQAVFEKSNNNYPHIEESDRWQFLAPDFVEKWSAFREPPVTRSLRLLRALCRRRWVHHVIARIRKLFGFYLPQLLRIRL